MITAAVHIIFVWILGMTIQAKTTTELPVEKPEVKQERVIENPAPDQPAPAEKKDEAPGPAI